MDGSGGQRPWPSSIPELSTERLRLRAPRLGDAAALLDLIGDPEVTRHINVETITSLAEARAVLEGLARRYAARDMIRWAIELVGHTEMIGTVGLLRFDVEHRHAELGYDIARRWWGRGLVPEAAGAVIRYGFADLGLHRIEAGVRPGNDASVRVLQKLGFVEEGTRRDYLCARGRFYSFRWFSLLETDPSPDLRLSPSPTPRPAPPPSSGG
jgi:ribosomal-protein-alanine N-acetyltransferase